MLANELYPLGQAKFNQIGNRLCSISQESAYSAERQKLLAFLCVDGDRGEFCAIVQRKLFEHIGSVALIIHALLNIFDRA